MLVLTRKTGQQVVLPELGITINVVQVSNAQVRLGIAAPSDISIHRREVWNRVRGTSEDSSTSSADPSERLATADEPNERSRRDRSPSDIRRCLIRQIVQRTGGRVNQLSVETRDDRIVVHGSARSNHVRRLAQAAIDEVVNLCDDFSPGRVECHIDVGQLYWRSAGCTQSLKTLNRMLS